MKLQQPLPLPKLGPVLGEEPVLRMMRIDILERQPQIQRLHARQLSLLRILHFEAACADLGWPRR